MRYLLLLVVPAVIAAGCVKASDVTDTAEGVRDRVTPAAREIAAGSRRLVRAAGQAADDAALIARVKGILASRKGFESDDIRVAAQDGVVTLTGRVSTREQKRQTGEIVGATLGVQRVVNRLEVGRVRERVNGGGG